MHLALSQFINDSVLRGNMFFQLVQPFNDCFALQVSRAPLTVQ